MRFNIAVDLVLMEKLTNIALYCAQGVHNLNLNNEDINIRSKFVDA